MSIWGVAGIVILVALVLPPTVYICTKLAAYAWKRGQQVFNEEQQTQRREQNGYEES